MHDPVPHDGLIFYALLSRVSLLGSEIGGSILIPIFGLMVLGAAVGLRPLHPPGLDAAQGLWSRTPRWRLAVVRNIAVRKAAASLWRAHSLREIHARLRECLAHDFDAFSLTLAPQFLSAELQSQMPGGLLECRWNDDAPARYRLRIEITAPSLGTVGELLLMRSFPRGLIIDSQLLTSMLSQALGAALEQWISQSALASN